MFRGLLVLLALVGLGAGDAQAQEVPEFDVPGHCEKQAETLGNSAFMKKSCLQQEQQSYDTLKADWPGLSSQIKKTCIAQAKSFLPSYFMLNACVQQEVASQKEVDAFQFKK